MKKIQLINDDYCGHTEHLRHAARGILVHDGMVLLSYETVCSKYIIPGGGVEEGETFEESCVRELLEETGMKVRTTGEYLEIEELFLDWRHINHYFACELVEDTGCMHLTSGEKEAGYKNVWVPLDEAVEIFGDYERFHDTDIADYGLYRREYQALKEYRDLISGGSI
jgi:ADP-ribose pyrophosphatase YjhB (NUDIX family)